MRPLHNYPLNSPAPLFGVDWLIIMPREYSGRFVAIGL
jgi:hypothetical protein